jgi:hypothetical protein
MSPPNFLKIKKTILLLVLFPVITSCASVSSGVRAPAPLTGLAMLQGYTDEHSTQLTVLVPKDKKFNYFVRAESKESEFELRDIQVQRFAKGYSQWAIDRIYIRGLELDRPYRFEVYDAYDTLIDAREMYALDITRPQARIAAASCMNDAFVREQKKIWPELFARTPQILFLLGDNVYAKNAKPSFGALQEKHIWRRYVETRLSLDIFRQPRLIPTLAIWDDGDYAMTNGDRTNPVRKAATEIFRTFYAQEPDFKKLFSGPGTARWLRAFQMNFALMDNRSFRSPVDVTDPDEQTHWGAAQERWLHENLKDSVLPTWILNGDQIFGAYHPFESYERDHPANLKEQLTLLAAQPAPVVFLTGDRHITEVMSVPGEKEILSTFEITTSPLHARVFPSRWEKEPNPRQIDGVAGKMNYMIMETENLGGTLAAKLTLYSLDNEILFHRFLSVEKKTKKLLTK